jgi:hypothetical protein
MTDSSASDAGERRVNRPPPLPASEPVVLNYRPVVPARRRAEAIRILMLVVAIGAVGLAGLLIFNPALEINPMLGGGALGTPFGPFDGTLPQQTIVNQYIPYAGFYFGLFLFTQYLFLLPRGQWRISVTPDAPISCRAAVAAGFIGMLLSIGLIATLMEIPNWWIKFTTVPSVRGNDAAQSVQHFGAIWMFMGIFWLVWTFVFWRYGKSLDRYSALRKIFRWLLAGTILELLIACPAHAAIIHSRGDDCYCARGTWTGVAFGCTAALWLFGPGAFLLFLREKRRRTRLI